MSLKMFLKTASSALNAANFCCRISIQRRLSFWKSEKASGLRYSEEVKEALCNGSPVVALESTIITHGMPYPDNLTTAFKVESVVRKHKAIPATIAILKGNVHIGLTALQMEELAKPDPNVCKTSRRDFPYVLSQGLSGGTTVSGTMIVAEQAGIPIFVTGGIGGVHRGVEDTMDVSADLTELGRTPIAVVSSGVKSILDIGKTLEYLETQGVCVAVYGATKNFPSFFTPESGHMAPYNITNPVQAAQLIKSNINSGLHSGILIAVPIPSGQESLGKIIESAIQTAVEEAKKKNIVGKEVTPFILQKVNEITEGQSLEANKILIENNAMIGSQIAVELCKLKEKKVETDRPDGEPKIFGIKNCSTQRRPVVIGGINVDFSATFAEDNIKPNGATYKGHIKQSFGGVGRNLADCLTRLGANPIFLSVVGNDSYADLFYEQCKHIDLDKVYRYKEASTATYCAMLRRSGHLIYGIGDFDIHTKINKEYLSLYENDIRDASMVVMDGNIPATSMEYICGICNSARVPVWFEPTDMHHVSKLFKSSAWQELTYCSPNMNELRMLNSLLQGQSNIIDKDSGSNGSETATIEEALQLSKQLIQYIPNLLVTMGEYGAMYIRQNINQESDKYTAVHYRVPQLKEPIVSVSGAGDCLAAAVIYGLIQNLPEEHFMASGLLAAEKSLLSNKAIPDTIQPDIMYANHEKQ